jgi:oligopeptide/dipeptide ABC transporter ATP-binding protein
VLSKPSHPYTQALLDAVPRGLERRARRVLPVETVETEGGCRFRSRCVHAMAVCVEQMPALRNVGTGHLAACHLRDPAASSYINGDETMDRADRAAATATFER